MSTDITLLWVFIALVLLACVGLLTWANTRYARKITAMHRDRQQLRERTLAPFLLLADGIERPPLSERDAGVVSERTAALADAAAMIRLQAGCPQPVDNPVETAKPDGGQPRRTIRLGETVDLAPHEVVDVVARDGIPLLTIDGGPGGMTGVRFG